MNSKFIFIVAAVLFASLSINPVSADFQKTKIAVLDFQPQGAGQDPDMGKIVAEWLTTALVKQGRFDVVERVLLKKIIEEQNFSSSGLADQQSVVELGKLLGVQVIISGSVVKFQDILEVNARIIDVKDASIIVAESVKSTTATRLEDLVVQMAEKIILDFPLEGYVVNVDGKNVTVDLGKIAGVQAGMKFSIYREGEVIKHPKTGEILDVTSIQTGVVVIKSISDKTASGTLIEETSAGSVEYGQMVKSIPEINKKSVPASAPSIEYTKTTSSPAPKTPRNASSSSDPNIQGLKSGNPAIKNKTAKIIYKRRIFTDEILETVNEELLNGYNEHLDNRYHIDAMSWLCIILGSSGDTNYKPTLETVSVSATNKKIKGHALKYLKQLK